MKQPIKLGFVDYTTLVFIPDPASTDGSGKTGLVAANLTVSYTRVETDNDVAVTDVTSSLNNLAALTSAHNDWGILEVSSTLAPGLYRLDIADAVFASGAWTAVVYLMITTSAAAPAPMEFLLVAYDINDTVRLGLTALPNAVPGAAGGVFIAGTNAPVTITGSGNALSLTSTGGNGNGLLATGNGSGSGVNGQGGATGNGFAAVGGANGNGVLALGGASAGAGARFAAQAGDASGWEIEGNGAGAGIDIQGGATGAGLLVQGGATSGDGIHASATDGDGIEAVGAGGGNQDIKGDIAGNITGNVSGSVGSVTGAVGSVTGAVGSVAAGGITAASIATDAIDADALADGAITAATFAAGAITATVIATNAIDADALAADALTEIQASAAAALVAIHLDHLLAVEYDATAKPGDAEALLNALVEPDDGSPVIPRFTANALEQAPTGTGGSGGDCPTALEIADAVWDEDATAHQTQGSFGQAIGDPVADTNTIYKAVVTDAAGATVGVDVVAVKAETASIQSDTNDIQTRLPAALVSGRMDSSVGAMAANVVTAASIATDAIDADAMADGAITAGTFAAGAIDATAIAADAIGSSELAASAVTEIQSGLATSAALAIVQADTDDIQTRLPAALVGGRMDASVGAVANDAITAASIAADAIGSSELAASAVTEMQSGLATAAALATVQADTDDIQTRLPAALVGGRIDASVGAVANDAITAAAIATDAIGANEIAASAVTEIQAGLSTLTQADVRSAVGLASANLDTQLDALPTATENADALLKRDMSSVTGESARSPLNAFRFQRNKFTIAGGVLTVFKEDDTSVAWTAVITQTAGDPVSASDPA